jgi:hypothetical protein
MSLKLKILGLGVLAVMATSAFAVMNASATVSGHFTHDAATNHATIVAAEEFEKPDSLKFQATEPTNTNSGLPIVCEEATYHGLAAAKTTTSLTVAPKYGKCLTTGKTPGEITVTPNGCTYTFFSNSAAVNPPGPTTHATVNVNCPVGQKIEIHHPDCTISVHPQTGLKGATYTTTTVNNKHALTVNVTITHIKSTYHGGICIFLGTNHEFDMTGAVKVSGFDTAGVPVNITAT